jgi:DNA-binding MarR family transcriptional regulator
MIIHTKELIIKNNNLKFLDENQNTDIVLKSTDRVMKYFIKNRRTTTKNIERDLYIKPRTVRKAVKSLEMNYFIKRIDTKTINKKI